VTAPLVPPGSAGEGAPDGPRPGDRLDRWITIEPDGSATVHTGKVEVGQGLHVALAQLVADELDLPFERVRVAPVDTASSPDEGVTAGSRSMEETGRAIHRVAAEVRAALLDAAASRLGALAGDLSIGDGEVAAPDGRRVAYAALAGSEALARPFAGTGQPKPPGRRRLLGDQMPRADLAAKVTGRPYFVQDLELPGMLHGRVVRPPGPGATLAAFDTDAVTSLPGVVAVVRDGRFLGVVAEREEQAIVAAARARRAAAWDDGPPIPSIADPRYLLTAPSEETLLRERRDEGALSQGVRTFRAEYTRPYLAHAAIGPSCAIARFDADGWTTWSHTQGPFRLRNELSRVLGVDPADVRVIHANGPGCYGHNGADDVALDAALLARAVRGRPVRVQWMRDDEFAWEPFGTPMVVQIAAAVDGEGRIVDWRHDVWGHGSGSRPTMAARPGVASLLAARHLADPFAGAQPMRAGDLRNAAPIYSVPNERIAGHYVPEAPLRISSLRSLGSHANVFAIESMLDEIAEAVGADPIELRLRHLDDERGRAVIEAVAELAGWKPRERGDGERGRGLGFARCKDSSAYAAVIAEVELGRELRVTRAWAGVDAGMVVSRDGLRNQVEGGIVQAVSWTLHEAVQTDGSRVATRDWASYRTLRFSEAPEVDVILVDRPDDPPMGVGEALAGPTTAAIANAVANAVGLRVRDLPFTRRRLEGAIA
jgi:CO/xanthine dehydrogenase Mo-binding subunit